MASNVVRAPDLGALVKPVRALLRKNRKIDAIKLVRERTDCRLKECKEFVEHVHAWPSTRAKKVADLWINITRDESLANTLPPELKPAATPESESVKRESNDAKGISLADWYAYMETHTYAKWEQLLEKCVAMKQAEESGFESGGANDNREEL